MDDDKLRRAGIAAGDLARRAGRKWATGVKEGYGAVTYPARTAFRAGKDVGIGVAEGLGVGREDKNVPGSAGRIAGLTEPGGAIREYAGENPATPPLKGGEPFRVVPSQPTSRQPTSNYAKLPDGTIITDLAARYDRSKGNYVEADGRRLYADGAGPSRGNIDDSPEMLRLLQRQADKGLAMPSNQDIQRRLRSERMANKPGDNRVSTVERPTYAWDRKFDKSIRGRAQAAAQRLADTQAASAERVAQIYADAAMAKGQTPAKPQYLTLSPGQTVFDESGKRIAGVASEQKQPEWKTIRDAADNEQLVMTNNDGTYSPGLPKGFEKDAADFKAYVGANPKNAQAAYKKLRSKYGAIADRYFPDYNEG